MTVDVRDLISFIRLSVEAFILTNSAMLISVLPLPKFMFVLMVFLLRDLPDVINASCTISSTPPRFVPRRQCSMYAFFVSALATALLRLLSLVFSVLYAFIRVLTLLFARVFASLIELAISPLQLFNAEAF